MCTSLEPITYPSWVVLYLLDILDASRILCIDPRSTAALAIQILQHLPSRDTILYDHIINSSLLILHSRIIHFLSYGGTAHKYC